MEDQPVAHLPIDYLQPNPLQPRGVITPESLAELVDSIKTHGIIQPLVVAHTPAGYQIIAGERRWRASKLAGLKEVPVRIIETSPQGMLEMAIVENVQRTDLNPIDRANSFERLVAEFGLSNTEICTRIGKSPAFVSNTLRLLELPDALKDGLISGVITEGHARALAAIPDTQSIIEAYKIILREGGSVRRAEDLARRFKKGGLFRNLENVPNKVPTESIDSMATEIQRFLGDNTRVKMRRSRVETAISIVLRGNPDQTEKQIQQIYASLLNKNDQPTKQESTLEEAEIPVETDQTQEESSENHEETTQSVPASPNTYYDPFEPITTIPSSQVASSNLPSDPENDSFSEY